MNTLNLKSILFALLFLLLSVVNLNATESRHKYNFNHGWKLLIGDPENAENRNFDDSDWQQITLPYAWNQSEAFKNDIIDLSTGIAWYRKTFQLQQGDKPAKIFIEFEGVRQLGEVYVNGHFIGRSENGVMAFGFDITSLLKPYPAQNIIAVRTNNDWRYKEKLTGSGFQWNNNNFNANYGGIPKNVFLHTTSSVYQTLPLYSSLGTTGTYVYATDIDIKNKQAVIHVETQVRNESDLSVDVQLEVKVEDMDGKIVASYPGDIYSLPPNGMKDFEASDTVKSLNFWSWGYGYLYNVYSELKINGEIIDRVKTRTGFRKTKFANGMIWLNERVIMMKGYAQRTSNEWPSVGMSVPAWLSDYSNSLIIKGNGNMVRWMHVTPWKQDIQSCSRVGLIQAMPAGDAEKDIFDHRWKQRTDLMRDAIIYNRNDPSILFYECGNESISEEHMKEMKIIRNKYDPHGGRAIGSREMLDSKVAEYGGEMLYINKSADIPFWAMEYSRDEGHRKYWDEYTPPYHKDGDGPLYRGQPAPDYNRNQDSHAIEDVIRWYDYWEMRPGTGKRVSSGGANIIFSDTNTHHRGEENYRRSGEVDAMRIPKENYWAHKVIWKGWVDTDSTDIHIIGHWNYKNGIRKDITVVSTADNVELFVNNNSIGKGERSNHFLFTFKDVNFEPGTIKAVGFNNTGKKVCETQKKTVGEPFALKLTTIERPGGMLADGQDLAVVQVEVIDRDGNRCPTALNMIHFNVKGVGEYIGGIAQGPDNFIGSGNLPVECGVNRVFIRSTPNAGKIQIEATSEGLAKASASIETKRTDVRALSEIMPDEHLPSFLTKGPTPETPSYSTKRIAIEITGAKAAVNQDKVAYSYDDNELTEWHNSGKLENGQITYFLERSAELNQCVLKLTGWRMREYPIRILVDSTVVYTGVTPKSLGYVTLALKPVKGQSVTIELIGASSEKDEFNQIVELEPNQELDLYRDPNAPKSDGQLRIIEVEFYEPVSTEVIE